MSTTSRKLLTLTDGDIVSQRAVSRRSLLGSFGIGLGLAAAGVVANVGTARAQRRSPGCTDNDGGAYEDPVGRGRNCRPEDERKPGRGGPGKGRGPRGGGPAGCTDTDSGPQEDQVGSGRSCANRRRTGCTDRDGGPNSDPPEFGTGCWV
jgi:hypothetical protein